MYQPHDRVEIDYGDGSLYKGEIIRYDGNHQFLCKFSQPFPAEAIHVNKLTLLKEEPVPKKRSSPKKASNKPNFNDEDEDLYSEELSVNDEDFAEQKEVTKQLLLEKKSLLPKS